MPSWHTKSSEIVYETPWIKVRRDEVLNHLQKPLTYSVVDAQHPSVFIVALNSNGQILLQQNYRYTIDKVSWELPAGHSDGQDPITAGKRELLEETGLESDDWTVLGKLYQAVGIANLPMYVLVARDVRPAQVKPDEDSEQIIEQAFFTPGQIDDMIKESKAISAGEIAAYYMARLQRF